MHAPPTRSPITLAGSLSLHPVSLGAAMHRAGYEALGLSWVYVPFAASSADLAGALEGMRALRIRGFGVSMPFKIEVLPLLDRVDPLAARIGAVNTIVNQDGTLVGYNTDAAGAVLALREALPSLSERAVLVLGAGGAARAVAHGLAAEGGRVSIANRTDARAAALAATVRASAHVSWHEVQQGPSRFDVIVNASSAGMDGGGGVASPLPRGALCPSQVVMDIVYRPIETELVRDARACGATVVHGGRMLLHQAARQFELYTEQAAPLEAMAAALERGL